MGARLAAEALRRGHRVEMVCGPVEETLPAAAAVVRVETADEMERALRQRAARADLIIMAAAVSDFRPARAAARKQARHARMTLRLTAIPDIVARLPRRRHQVVAGFALETGPVVARARRKLLAKRLDLVLAQRANATAARRPFGRRQVEAWLLSRAAMGPSGGPGRDGRVVRLGRTSKARVARVLLDKLEALWYGQQSVQVRRARS
jgi:phosphopantothenoylcysteine decarboxylase/phosphopantothenate--cysteine ligase